MVVLRLVILIIFLIGSPILFATEEEVFDIKRVEVQCLEQDRCEEFQSKLSNLKNQKFKAGELKDKLRFKLLDKSLRLFSYEVIRNKEGDILLVSLSQKKTVRSVELRANIDMDLSKLTKYMPVKSGEFFEEKHIGNSINQIRKYFIDRGYSGSLVEPELVSEGLELDVVFNIKVGRSIQVDSVNIIHGDGKEVSDVTDNRFLRFERKVWNKLDVKCELENLQTER